MSLVSFNALSKDEALEKLTLCCVSERWAAAVERGRPFDAKEALISHSNEVWAALSEADYLQAFEGHPKIGDVHSLREKYAASGDLAASEQSGVSDADDGVIERLAAGNSTYEEKFGFIFIVCATGKSAVQMCELLEQRLHNSRSAELTVAAEEQRKILTLRLEKLL